MARGPPLANRHRQQCSTCRRSRVLSGTEKLVVDFPGRSRLRGGMDEDKRDLINQLATRAGMLMEDASVAAITLRERPQADLIRTIQNLEAQVRTMASLLEAARTLCE